MKQFIIIFKKNWYFILIPLVLSLYVAFTFHDFFNGMDEIRMTLAAKEIAYQKNVYYQDKNNEKFDTNIFVKTAFLINKQKVIYPVGFTLNTLTLVPLMTLDHNSEEGFNIFFLGIYIFTYLAIYSVFHRIGMSKKMSIVGATIYCLSDYFLALFVSYYPDSILNLLFILFIYFYIEFINKKSKQYLLIMFILSAYLCAYKITMVPIFFIFYILHFFNQYKTSPLKSVLSKDIILLLSIVFIFIFPQIFTNKIGPNYNDISISSESNSNITTPVKERQVDKLQRKVNLFYKDFLLPKGNGFYIFDHIRKDILFFAINNFFTLFGILTGAIFLYRTNKKLFFLVTTIALPSYYLWANMNVYGGSDTFHLRNTHIRYLIPLITLFYILGFYYYIQNLGSKLLLMFGILFIITLTTINLRTAYPFAQYSLINKNGYYFESLKERDSLRLLSKNNNPTLLSAVFDEYDLSYLFRNYGDLKMLKDSKDDIIPTIRRVVNKSTSPVYVLIPISDSRYNPITPVDINNIETTIKNDFIGEIVMENKQRRLYLLHSTRELGSEI
jgi:hypothetical protein